MSGGGAWEGNWKARLYERVRERGYASLTAFAEARPAVPLYLLAEELGKDDVAGVQVLSGLLAEAEQRKQVTRFVRDVLVRMLSKASPTVGRQSWMMPIVSRLPRRSAPGLPTPLKLMRSASNGPGQRSVPRRHHPVGVHSAPMTSYSSRSCLMRKPELRPVERAMRDGRTWDGNWRARLYERVRERGYASLTAFAEARPAVPLYVLAEELGRDDVAAVQVLSGLLAEAEQRKQVTRFVRDVLVRQLSQSLPEGWPAALDDGNRFKVAKALGLWSAFTPEEYEERVDQVGDALLATPPPPGWRPLGPDDELLLTLLPDEEA